MAVRVGLTYRREEKAAPYARALRSAGADPIPITPGCACHIEELDALVVSGGTDIDPSYYGEAPHPRAEAPDRERDALEADLLRQAVESDLPMLAICRGMQLFNVIHGGTLDQHIEACGRHRIGPSIGAPQEDAHFVDVAEGTALARIIGAGRHAVNSRHHQAVRKPGDGLVVSAVSDDGIIEAIERADRRFALAVQWHPEDRAATDPKDLELFRALVAAARRR